MFEIECEWQVAGDGTDALHAQHALGLGRRGGGGKPGGARATADAGEGDIRYSHYSTGTLKVQATPLHTVYNNRWSTVQRLYTYWLTQTERNHLLADRLYGCKPWRAL